MNEDTKTLVLILLRVLKHAVSLLEKFLKEKERHKNG